MTQQVDIVGVELDTMTKDVHQCLLVFAAADGRSLLLLLDVGKD